MEWYPVMAGFSQGSTHLSRLTTLYGLDCVHGPYSSESGRRYDTSGNWEVQFGFDAEYKHQVEIVATPNPEIPHLPFPTFEFFDETDCLWSGQVGFGFGLHAEWGNQCGATAVEQFSYGLYFYEYKLCNSENECVRKDEVMIFEDEGEYLIFSRWVDPRKIAGSTPAGRDCQSGLPQGAAPLAVVACRDDWRERWPSESKILLLVELRTKLPYDSGPGEFCNVSNSGSTCTSPQNGRKRPEAVVRLRRSSFRVKGRFRCQSGSFRACRS